MSDVMRACAPTEPVMVAWNEYQKTEHYANSKKWAIHTEHVQGSLWGAFSEGFRLATERAAMLHEQVDPASDAERVRNALKFVRDIAEEELPHARVGTGAEVALRHINRRAS